MRVLLHVLAVACSAVLCAASPPTAEATDTRPLHKPRVAAEWEPVVGVLIGWPLKLPPPLVVEMARELDLHVTVSGPRSAQRARRTFEEWGIDPRRVHCIIADQGTGYYLTRDWGPFAVFDRQGRYRLVDSRYLDYPISGVRNARLLWLARLARLTYGPDDRAPAAVARALGCRRTELPIVLTGGNALFDGRGTGFASELLLAENRSMGVSKGQFLRILKEELGVEQFHFLPNFERLGIQHVDCLFKLLDEERMLVKRAPPDHPAFGHIENAAGQLSRLTNADGRHYQVHRIDTPRYCLHKLANYTNSLILNRKIYVPLFGIPADESALQTWRKVMPGYQVIGFPHSRWSNTDALHCRVRAIWDPKMLSLTHRLGPGITEAGCWTVEVFVRDHSGAGLIDQPCLVWRICGSAGWASVRLQPAEQEYLFRATIHDIPPGQAIDYYFSAASLSGRQETLPRTAPEGFYTQAGAVSR